MAIPEAQLSTWANQGAVAGSASTYGTIKNALEAPSANYPNRTFRIFLQGSYGNDTNIFAESDVDVVICYEGAYYRDLDQLSPLEKHAYESTQRGTVSYTYNDFKAHVEAALRASFGSSVRPGTKAIKVIPNGSRRSTDVIVAFNHRRYTRYISDSDSDYFEGISFFTSTDVRIDNFPGYHSTNATSKHQATGNNFKPAVRIFKNMRKKLIDDGALSAGDAPSYFIEGLLYNVPNNDFVGSSYQQMVLNILNWLHSTPDRRRFVCVNERHYLLRDNSPVCWPIANGSKFISAAINLWNRW